MIKYTFETHEETFDRQRKEYQDMLDNETPEQKDEREKCRLEIKQLAKELDAKRLLEKKKNVTVSNADNRKIEDLELSIENGEDAKNSDYGSCKNQLFSIGWSYTERLKDEFNDDINFQIKFDNDFIAAVEDCRFTSIQMFKDYEIERLNEIKDLIIKCFGVKYNSDYKNYSQYKALQRYLEFLQQPEPGDVAGKNNFNVNDFIEPAPEKFSHLPLSNLPTINKDIINPKFIIQKYYNKVFECSLDAFYAWLVYGRVYNETINWTYKKSPKIAISKAQLKLFINAITGDEEHTKVSFFDTIFGMKVERADYKNSHTLDKYFNDLIDEIKKNKLPKQ